MTKLISSLILRIVLDKILDLVYILDKSKWCIIQFQTNTPSWPVVTIKTVTYSTSNVLMYIRALPTCQPYIYVWCKSSIFKL